MNLPPWPRLPKVARQAFVLGIGKYHKYPDLPGAMTDLTRMYMALMEASFKVAMFSNVDYGKALKKQNRSGNIMQLFDLWCKMIDVEEAVDATVYYAGHGMRFQGEKWLIPAKADLKSEQSVLLQCVQLNYLRVALAERDIRVTVFILDCCDIAVGSLQFVSKKVWRSTASVLPPESKLVDLKDHHQSSMALNTYIFHGAASSTKAKEVQSTEGAETQAAGAFTTAFITNMAEENRTLDELSEMIRSEMTGIHGIDDADPDEQSSMRRRSVQISPTENFLQHEFRGWCFYESEPMCMGTVTSDVENCLRSFVNLDFLSSMSGHSRSDEMSVGASRGVDGDEADSDDSELTKAIKIQRKSQRLTEAPGAGVGDAGDVDKMATAASSTSQPNTTSGEQIQLHERKNRQASEFGNFFKEIDSAVSVVKPSEADPKNSVEMQPVDDKPRAQTLSTDIAGSSWKEYIDPSGKKYYYNTDTKKTQWTKPEGLPTVEEDAAPEETPEEGLSI